MSIYNQDHIVEANKKVSSVSQLLAEIQRRIAIIQSEPQTMARELMIDNLSIDLEKYEAMHKEEIINAVDGFPLSNRNLEGAEYYTKTYGGNNE